MTSACSRCGAAVPEGARYCPRCGAPIEAAVSEERRVVTVLFADLTDSTRLASTLDSERFREVQAAFYREAAERLAALRGRVEKFVGDAVMAVFGLPHAHEDDALRAVRAGLEISDRTQRLGEELGLPAPLRVRIGMASGPVVVGAGPADQFLASGPSVNLAARLQQAAEPGEVLAGETTQQLTHGAVEFGPSRSVEAKGFDVPVSARPVLAMSLRTSRRTIPLIGRRRELRMLSEVAERARETSRLHLVTILGEPGVGKSRLADEFLDSLGADVKVMRGRTSRFSDDAHFAPLAEMFRREIGAEPSASPEELRRLLGSFVAGACGTAGAEQTAERLGLVFGFGAERAAERPYRTAQVRTGLLALLEGLARTGPVVLAIEDLELGRPDLFELVEQIGARRPRLPVLVLCIARDEMMGMRPGWAGGLADAMTIRLDPLAPADAVELARASARSLDDATAERIARHAGGNPFFIVETTGMLLHDRSAAASGSTEGGGDAGALPATVQAVVASRIDHLDPLGRDLVRKASVFARSTFRLDELSLVADASEETLGRLEDEELFVRDPSRPLEWRFNHEVVRDVAYGSLAKRERLRLHTVLADRLEATARYPAAIAYHLEHAARASLDLDPSDRAVAERAVEALHAAGDRARRRMESRDAVDLYERALSLAGPESGWGVREARMLGGTGEARYWLGDFVRSRESLERALGAGPDDTWTRCVAHRFLGDIALNIDGRISTAEEHFALALEAARLLRADDRNFALARTLLVAGWAPYMRDDLTQSRAMFEEALAVARANTDGDPWAEARALTFICSIISAVEGEHQTIPLIEQALAVGRKMNDPFTTAVAQQRYATALAITGRLDEGLPQAEAAAAAFADLGARWETASALGDVGELRRLSGRPRDAEQPLREALAICRELGDRQQLGWVAAELARSLRMQGRGAEGRVVLDEASSQVDLYGEPAMLRARALLAFDAADEAGIRAATERMIALSPRAAKPNAWARATWFTSRLLGPQAAGGDDAVRGALEQMEAAGWVVWLRDPDLPLATI